MSEETVGGFTNEINRITDTLAKASDLGVKAKSAAELQEKLLKGRSAGVIEHITVSYYIAGREHKLAINPITNSIFHDELVSFGLKACASTIDTLMKQIAETVTPIK